MARLYTDACFGLMYGEPGGEHRLVTQSEMTRLNAVMEASALAARQEGVREAELASALAADNCRLRDALEWIAAKPDESDEWDGRDKFHECRDHAREAIAPHERARKQ